MPLNHINITRLVMEGDNGKEHSLDSVSCLGRRVNWKMQGKHDDINHIQRCVCHVCLGFSVCIGHAISVISMFMLEAS